MERMSEPEAGQTGKAKARGREVSGNLRVAKCPAGCALRPGLMQSEITVTGPPRRPDSGVALHNYALRIIGDGSSNLQQ